MKPVQAWAVVRVVPGSKLDQEIRAEFFGAQSTPIRSSSLF